ncbi:hypothetical protein [Angustibacter aerolatus]
MHPTGPRQLPLPAEVARTLLHGLGRATVSGPLDDRPDDAACSPGPAHGVADGATAVPAVHGALPDGTVVLALPADATVRLLPGGGEPEGRALRLCVRAEAPLPDLTLPRAHLEVLGWAARARPGQRAGALEALAATWPITNLLAHAPRHDLLLVDVAEVELHWVGGCVTLAGDDVRAAVVDLVAVEEDALLGEVQSRYGHLVLAVVRGLAALPVPGGGTVRLDRTHDVRAIGLDRFGLTVQALVAGARGAERHVVRLPFARPVEDVESALQTVGTELLTQRACHETCRSSASAAAQDLAEPLQP